MKSLLKDGDGVSLLELVGAVGQVDLHRTFEGGIDKGYARRVLAAETMQ